MPFHSGHKKRGGRRAGTPNKLTGEAREVARRLLGDADYQRTLQKRLSRGEAPRVELHLWELAYGKPRPQPDAPGLGLDLAELLERISKKREQDIDPRRALVPSDPRGKTSGIQRTEGQGK